MRKTIDFENLKQIAELHQSIQALDMYRKIQRQDLCAQFGNASSDYYAAVKSYAALKQETQTARAQLTAKMATHILLGYDIAQPGQYLHEHDLYHYLGRLPATDRRVVTTAWTQSGRTRTSDAIPAPYLHIELLEHDVWLLDTHYCMEMCHRIRDLTIAIQGHYANPENIINPISDYEQPFIELMFSLQNCVPSLRQKCHADDTVALAQLWLWKLREKLKQNSK